MPNNENNYRIQLEFASFLRGLPGFRISDSESADFVNVTINYHQNSLAYFSRSGCRLPRYSQHYIIEQLFVELEKDHVDREELIRIGMIFKRYLLLLKQIDIDRAYYAVTPGLMAGLFIVLHLSLLFLPNNRTLIYGGLTADLYGLGFWLFSVWSFSKNEQVLHKLESKLMEEINFLKSLSSSVPQAVEYYPGSSESILPCYQDVLWEDAMRSNGPNFFNHAAFNNEFSASNTSDHTDPRRPERCYSV